MGSNMKFKPKSAIASQYLDAARELVDQLNATPVAHSVFVHDYYDPVTKEITRELCVAIRPEYLDRIIIPATCSGIPVVQVPWPDDE
jgi:hypothetical protein